MAGAFFQQYSKLSSPIPLANLKLWLKADAGITLNGSKVSVWADQSGNGNDATQSNAVLQPLFVSNLQNGLPGVYFNNKYLSLTNDINISGGNYSIFMALKGKTASGYINIGYFFGGNQQGVGYFSGYSGWYYGQFCGTGATATDITHSFSTNFNIYEFFNQEIYIDNVSCATTLKDTQQIIYNTIGDRSDHIGFFSNMYLSELIVYDVKDRLNIYAYLKQKYGI